MFATTNKDDLGTNTKNAAENLRHDARRVRDDVRDAAGAVRDDLNDLAHSAGQHVRQMADEAETTLATYVHDKPLTSLGIAVGAGIILGMLFRR